MRPTRISFFWMFVILTVAQMLITNYLHLSYYITLSLLPTLILFLPIRIGTVSAMVIAFITGFAVDFFAEGLIGINMLSLVPVAFIRRSLLSLVFGGEIFARQEDPSAGKNGIGAVLLAILLAEALFLAVYILADGAGMRPVWFNLIRFVCSLGVGTILSMFAADLLTGDKNT
ncbi:MAG: rod shape-determining protein MreD [Bacteroidota bacterium]|nr:rod shape-determining protein MreD [Bacteroidota bacterium]